MNEPIDSFYVNGVHLFLSNFYPSPFTAHDREWATVEHYYQAMKAADWNAIDAVRLQSTPGKAKRAGRAIALRSDWEEIKLLVMRRALVAKFPSVSDWSREAGLSARLVSTEDAHLVEGNTWGDTFWGVCRGDGMNWLGHLLMARRAELRASMP